ncbi:MAG: hypothetical protein ACRD4S_16885 [Candidatus Acidiferrales bacterium]
MTVKTELRWETKFARFVADYGVSRLAWDLGVVKSAVYHWIRGAAAPHPAKALAIKQIAKNMGVDLSFEEIYEVFLHDEIRKTAP